MPRPAVSALTGNSLSPTHVPCTGSFLSVKIEEVHQTTLRRGIQAGDATWLCESLCTSVSSKVPVTPYYATTLMFHSEETQVGSALYRVMTAVSGRPLPKRYLYSDIFDPGEGEGEKEDKGPESTADIRRS